LKNLLVNKGFAFLSVGMIYHDGRKMIEKRGTDSTTSSTNFGAVNANWSSRSDAKIRISHKCP